MDLLLGADTFSRVVLHGPRFGPTGTPSAFKTQIGWVLTSSVGHNNHQKSCYFTITEEGQPRNDDLLKKFWEIESPYLQDPTLSVNERKVLQHFEENHHRDAEGRFIVPLPLNSVAQPLGESRTRAVRRFTNLEKSLHAKTQFTVIRRMHSGIF